MSSTSRFHKAEVPGEAAGQRLDRWLSEFTPELSRNRIQKLIEDERVQVDGRLRPARYRLKGTETIEWEIPPDAPSHLEGQDDVDFDIIHEDEDLAVIDKPAGLVVHPAPGHGTGTLVHGLLAKLSGLSAVGGVERPGLVHRLDKDTSGLLVVAKNDRAHRILQEQLGRRELSRVYRALCWGSPKQAKGEIEAPLDRHPRDRKRRAVIEGGRYALTRYELLEELVGASHLELRLHTGRTHQIRVHLTHLGHPVLGDELYGGGEKRLKGAAPEHREVLRAALKGLGRQALHAHALGFSHPSSGEMLEFVSPLPGDFETALRRLRSSQA